MCTAISFNSNGHYFGRTLDLERRYNEQVVITPRKFAFEFKFQEKIEAHYAIIGIATVIDDYPLYYDATNEYGLSMAGLNFVGNAHLEKKSKNGKINLAPYELIPFILGTSQSVRESIELFEKINLVDEPFKSELPNAELHWIVSDKKESITVEFMREERKIYNNPVGVLTNNPSFDYQMMNLNNYMQLTSETPKNSFSKEITLTPYSRGMGAIGLPGDLSSVSRFVRVCFTKMNSVKPINYLDEIGQFFHILGTVEQCEGCAKVGDHFEITQYTSCCDTEKGIYYYKTYRNCRINAVGMYSENLDSCGLICFDMIWDQEIKFNN